MLMLLPLPTNTMRTATLQITVIICLVALARQQPCRDISDYLRSDNGDSCPSNNVVELCRWQQVKSKPWEERTIGGETYAKVEMAGMDEYSPPIKLLSSKLCGAASTAYNFSFQYHLENRRNCELTVQLKKVSDYAVLWNSSWPNVNEVPQSVFLYNATCDCRYQIVFEVRKYNRYSCSYSQLNNFIGIRDIGYSSLAAKTAISPSLPMTTTTTTITTATATTRKTSSQRTADPVITSVTAFNLTGATRADRNPAGAATTTGSAQGSISTKAALTKETIAAEDKTLNVGATVGAVLGVVAAVIVAVALVLFLKHRRNKNCKACTWMSKFMNSKPGGPARAVTNSAYITERGNTGPITSSTPAGQPVYELADATHLQEYANLQYPRSLVGGMGYQVPCQPQRSRRYQESGLEESVLGESNYDIPEDTHAGNYYSAPDDAASDNTLSTTTNSVTATTTGMHQPRGDNVYQLSDEPNMGRNRVLPEDSYNKLSHLNPRSQALVPEGAHPYNHTADDARNKTPTDGSEYSLAHADDPRYSQIGEALRNTRTVPLDGNEYLFADDHNAETNAFSSTPIEADFGVGYSLGHDQDDTESGMFSPQPQKNSWSEYSLAGSHGNTDATDIAATSSAHVDYYNTVDFNARVKAGPMEEYNALNFDSSNSKDGDKRDRQNDGYSHVMKRPKPPNRTPPTKTDKVQSDYDNDNQNAVYHVLEEQSD